MRLPVPMCTRREALCIAPTIIVMHLFFRGLLYFAFNWPASQAHAGCPHRGVGRLDVQLPYSACRNRNMDRRFYNMITPENSIHDVICCHGARCGARMGSSGNSEAPSSLCMDCASGRSRASICSRRLPHLEVIRCQSLGSWAQGCKPLHARPLAYVVM